MCAKTADRGVVSTVESCLFNRDYFVKSSQFALINYYNTYLFTGPELETKAEISFARSLFFLAYVLSTAYNLYYLYFLNCYLFYKK